MEVPFSARNKQKPLANDIPKLNPAIPLNELRTRLSILPLLESRAQTLIFTSAVRLYRHEKLTSFWTVKCKDERNTLAFFLDQVQLKQYASNTVSRLSDQYFQLRPQPSALKNAQHRRTISSLGHPTFAVGPFVPLAQFEDLWYAAICKTKELYADIELRLENKFLAFTDIMHSHGPDFASSSTFRANEMVGFLDSVWKTLTDTALVRALDIAVNTFSMNPAASDYCAAHIDDHATRTCRFDLGVCANAGSGMSQRGFGWFENTKHSSGPGILVDATFLPPAIIVANLCEKRRRMLSKNAESEAKKDDHNRFGTTIEEHVIKAEDTLLFSDNLLVPLIPFVCLCSEECSCRNRCLSSGSRDCMCQFDPFRDFLKGEKFKTEPARDLFDDDDTSIYEDPAVNLIAPEFILSDRIENNNGLAGTDDSNRANKEVRKALRLMIDGFIERRLNEDGILPISPKSPSYFKPCSPQFPTSSKISAAEKLPLTPPSSVIMSSEPAQLAGLLVEPLTPTKQWSVFPTTASPTPDSSSLFHWPFEYGANELSNFKVAPLTPTKSQHEHKFEDHAASVANEDEFSTSVSPPSREIRPAIIARRFVSAGPGTSNINDRPEVEWTCPPPAQTWNVNVTLEQVKQFDIQSLTEELAVSFRNDSNSQFFEQNRQSRTNSAHVASRKRKRTVIKESVKKVFRRKFS